MAEKRSRLLPRNSESSTRSRSAPSARMPSWPFPVAVTDSTRTSGAMTLSPAAALSSNTSFSNVMRAARALTAPSREMCVA